MVADLLGGAVCLARSCCFPWVCSWQGCRAHQAQVSQEDALCPFLKMGMPWVKA